MKPTKTSISQLWERYTSRSWKERIPDRYHKYYRKRTLYIILIGLLVAVLLYQQWMILTLQEQITQMNDRFGDDTLANKIYHIDYIQDSHTSDIYKTKIRLEKLEDEVRGIQSAENELKWRIMQLEWGEH